jgi:hypothetical protein
MLEDPLWDKASAPTLEESKIIEGKEISIDECARKPTAK